MTDYTPLPRRPGAGLAVPDQWARLPEQIRRDRRPMYAVLGTRLVEIAPGVYCDAHRAPALWQAEPVKLPDGRAAGMVLTVYIDCPK